MKKSNIILIGMPGSGKSSIGRRLARKLNMQCIDGDAIMEEAEGCRLQEIIDRRGLPYFLELEGRVLASLTYENYVISPGGSAVYYPEAMAHLAQIGCIVYLKVDREILRRRIGDTMYTRGIAFREGFGFDELYEERAPLYERYAEITVDSSRMTEGQTVRAALKELAGAGFRVPKGKTKTTR